jgi:hypothetical protein
VPADRHENTDKAEKGIFSTDLDRCNRRSFFL